MQYLKIEVLDDAQGENRTLLYLAVREIPDWASSNYQDARALVKQAFEGIVNAHKYNVSLSNDKTRGLMPANPNDFRNIVFSLNR